MERVGREREIETDRQRVIERETETVKIKRRIKRE